MYYLILASLLFSSCSNFEWNEVEIQGVKKDLTKVKEAKPKTPPDPRNKLIGRYKFAGANIEKATGELVQIRACPRDSLFIEKNEFNGLTLTFRDSGEYHYENVFFINRKPPLNWLTEEDIKTKLTGMTLTQSRKRTVYKGKVKVYLNYDLSLERVDDLLFFTSKTTVYRPHKLFSYELIPDYLGELHCAYAFDSLSDEQKKARVRSMGY